VFLLSRLYSRFDQVGSEQRQRRAAKADKQHAYRNSRYIVCREAYSSQ